MKFAYSGRVLFNGCFALLYVTSYKAAILNGKFSTTTYALPEMLYIKGLKNKILKSWIQCHFASNDYSRVILDSWELRSPNPNSQALTIFADLLSLL